MIAQPTPAAPPAPTAPATVELGTLLTALMDRLISDLLAEGIADPLSERLMLACTLADVFHLAGVAAPPSVSARLGEY
jgi:hypothetical protein